VFSFKKGSEKKINTEGMKNKSIKEDDFLNCLVLKKNNKNRSNILSLVCTGQIFHAAP